MTRMIDSRLGRALILLAAAVLAVAALINALVNTLEVAKPDLALRLRPGDAAALTLQADLALAGAQPTAEDLAAVRRLATRALRSEPLTAPALRQLALIEIGAGHDSGAVSALNLAHRVTRRELGTQFVLISMRVASGDIPHALGYVDEALTANPSAADLLFPVIRADLADAPFRAALAPYVRADRPWMPKLLRYVLDGGSDTSRLVAALILDAGGLPVTRGYVGFNGAVLNALVQAADFDRARRYVALVTRARSGKPGMAGGVDDPAEFGPFAWHYANTADYDARPLPDGAVAGRMAPGHAGSVAVRLLLLSPGRYRAVVPATADAAGSMWQLSCLPNNTVVRWSQGASASFDVPSDCPAQELDLVVHGADFEELQFRTTPPIIQKLDGRGPERAF